MEVILQGGGRKVYLDEDQMWILAGELAKARSTHAVKGKAPGVAADCTIYIKGKQRDEMLEINSRAILYDPSHDESWQFYFGLLVMEWLYAAPAP